MVKYNKNTMYCLACTKRPTGLGLMLDLDPPYSSRERLFGVQLSLLWFRAWLVVYKKD